MKKKLALFILIMLSLTLLVNAFPSTPQINVYLLSQDPDPVEAGEVIELRFKVENIGVESKEDTILVFEPKYPFTLYGDSAEKNVGKLRTSMTGADAAIVRYKVKVDENAIEGKFPLEIYARTGSKIVVYNDDFNVNIQTRNAILDIDSITTIPEIIAPGEVGEIKIRVKNRADTLIRDIKIKLDLTSEDLPFAPYQSSSERRVSQLQQGLHRDLTFPIIVGLDANAGIYKIPLEFYYNDRQGNSYMTTDIVTLIIGAEPQIKYYVRSSDVLSSGNNGRLVLGFANSGKVDVKYFELELLPSEDYELISTSNYYYIGDLDSDDTDSEEINIYVHNKNELNIPLRTTYYDLNNRKYVEEVTLNLNLYNDRELKKYGIVSSNNVVVYLLILIIAGGGYFYYKKKNKKKE